MEFTAKEFGASFKGFMEQMASQAPAEDPVFLRRLRDHFQTEPAKLPVITERFEIYDHPNVHTAIESRLAEPGWSVETVGITGHQKYMGISLPDLVAPPTAALMGGAAAAEGPVEYVNISLDGDRVLTCVQCGLFLAKHDEERLAILVHGAGGFQPHPKFTVEVMARKKEDAERLLGDLRQALRKRNVYRGHILSLDLDVMQTLAIKFHHLPKIERENIILPDGLLERIERQTVDFSRHSQKLLAAGRHLKRGLLLFGAPGTGKTLTAMYLASAVRNQTVLLLTGRGLGLLAPSCSLARALQPSIVILEDVDLVAEERTARPAGCAQPLLFELLNEMDGLADDADVLFLLTTNRAELLEPALAARPGRIDQSFEIPLPDASCRQRLFDLYGRGLTLRNLDLPRFIERTDGASAAFIRELMRKAALFAADEGEQLVVSDRHVDEALHELLVEGGELTKSLLGFRAGK
jgi:ATP-dependent 26S proteasome regulatory subunit